MELSLEGVFEMVEKLLVVGCGDAHSTVGDFLAFDSYGVQVRRFGCGGCERFR